MTSKPPPAPRCQPTFMLPPPIEDEFLLPPSAASNLSASSSGAVSLLRAPCEPPPTKGLLDLLRAAHVDDLTCALDGVIAVSTAEALGALSATSRWYCDRSKEQLRSLHASHKIFEYALSCRLGYLELAQLEHVRALTIPDDLPEAMRPLLGRWLRQTGRLAKVCCVRCQSWIRTGELIPWIDLAPVRDQGGPHRDFGGWRSTEDLLRKFDTEDGLIATVLDHARSTVERVRLEHGWSIPRSKCRPYCD